MLTSVMRLKSPCPILKFKHSIKMPENSENSKKHCEGLAVPPTSGQVHRRPRLQAALSPHRCALFTALHNTFHFSLHYIISVTSPLVHTSTQSSRARQCSLFLPKFQLVVGHQLATRWHAAEKFSTPTHYYLRGQRRCIAAFFVLKSA